MNYKLTRDLQVHPASTYNNSYERQQRENNNTGNYNQSAPQQYDQNAPPRQ